MTFRFFEKREKEEKDLREKVDVVLSQADTGLTEEQVRLRAEKGYANLPVDPPGKTVGQIILSNVLTYFNIVFFALAACVIAVGSWYNLTFMPVVFANIFIGIFQELRSKRTLDKLSLLSSPKVEVIRSGQRLTLPTEELVRDDIAVFSAGSQICADAVVVSGECQVNEALITGEADEIRKQPGDGLTSGSFVVSGECFARLTAVGADSFVSRLTIEAKRHGRQQQSEMMRSLSVLVKWIGIILIPFGIIMCIKEVSWLGRSMQDGVVSTVAALIGMIPEGLYLLTSVALATGVVRLAMKKTLVHELSCIETLARVDTLCVDKTGTITENKMIVEDLVPLCEDRFTRDDIRMIMADYVFAMGQDNDTMAALRQYFTGDVRQTAVKTLPFSSARKYGGVSFHEEENYILGAPDIILGEEYARYSSRVEEYSARGCRVLLLGLYSGDIDGDITEGEMLPLALILLANKIRPEAPDTFAFFAKQGVTIRVISGDSALTVSEVAKRAGIANADRYVDARTLDTDKKIKEAAEKYVVFGRVTPEQKKKLVKAMKKLGHTVAMTGDGVNDVLALKEANCSIAMASGSDVACQVSNIVLLNSDFSSMPAVVMEGRRVINNIERSASLFLVKNIFSFALALISLIFSLPYPFTPSQLSLVSTLTIGVPSFVLALEPNHSLVKGRFLRNVLYRALPAALTDLVMVIGVMLFHLAFGISQDEMSTICAVVVGTVGLLMVHRTCKPYNALRKVLMGGVTVCFVLSAVFLKELFTLSPLPPECMLILCVFILLAPPALKVISQGIERLGGKFTPKRHKKTAGVES